MYGTHTRPATPSCARRDQHYSDFSSLPKIIRSPCPPKTYPLPSLPKRRPHAHKPVAPPSYRGTARSSLTSTPSWGKLRSNLGLCLQAKRGWAGGGAPDTARPAHMPVVSTLNLELSTLNLCRPPTTTPAAHAQTSNPVFNPKTPMNLTSTPDSMDTKNPIFSVKTPKTFI